jgi:hypothetical protein
VASVWLCSFIGTLFLRTDDVVKMSRGRNPAAGSSAGDERGNVDDEVVEPLLRESEQGVGAV